MEEIPLLGRNALDSVVGIFCRVVHAHQSGQVSACAHRLVDLVGDLFGFVPIADVGFDFVGDPFADFFAEGGVCFVVVWGMELWWLIY